jgi:hypothetical protein
MDPALGAAAQALSTFDPLGALKRIALRTDPPALALRGIAMAQLGDYSAARKLLGRAARSFEATDPRWRARCLAAEGEVALACRDLAAAGRALETAEVELAAHGDRINALFVGLQRVRLQLLLGNVSEALVLIQSLVLDKTPPRLRALAALVETDIAVRSLRARDARTAIARARSGCRAANIPSLTDEVERAARDLDAPVARLVRNGDEREALLDDIEDLEGERLFVVDACRREVRAGTVVIPFVTRPVLLALAVVLGRASHGEATREELIRDVFGGKRVSESLRVRLRVEIGRLRRLLAAIADVNATERGYSMRARLPRGASIVALLPPAIGEASALLALLRGGESWSTSALAGAIGSSQRTVQRALSALHEEGRVEVSGRGRSQRWVARPPQGFATALLLVTHSSSG